MPSPRIATFALALLLAAACGGRPARDGGGGARDAAAEASPGDGDAGPAEAGPGDAGREAAAPDGGRLDGGTDGGPGDAGRDAGRDAATDAEPDAAPVDAGRDAAAEAGAEDAGSGEPPPPPPSPCVSGAEGTHTLRFRWRGSGSGSRAWVEYEANTLPDTSRWSVSAASRSIGYRPVFVDPFLGDGGLELSGSTFIDVELSTAGLSRIDRVTLALRGRSYHTTASGSFSWRTFSGSGSTPIDFVSNAAPYRWYLADATASFVPGDRGVLLRIEAGPSSGALVVERVELCFQAR